METFSGNKIICEYMGFTVENPHGNFWARYKNGKYYGQFEKNDDQYHKEWNYLMPVIKKMQDEGLVKQDLFHAINDVYDALLTLDIIETWKAVVRSLKEREQKNI